MSATRKQKICQDGMRKCSGDLGSRPLRTGPPSSLTFLVRQAHGQNLPGGDGVFQKHVRELRGDSGPGRIGEGGAGGGH